MRKPWTDAECWKLSRAFGLYGRQRLLIQRFEFPERTPDSVNKIIPRLETWQPPEGAEKLPLRAELEPQVVAEEIAKLVSSRSSRSFIPKYFKPYLPETPEAVDTPADISETVELERKIIQFKDDIRLLRAKLKAAQRESNLFESLAEVIREENRPLPKANIPKRERSKGTTPVDGVLLLSDEHGDHVISLAGTWGLERYDFNIYRIRIQRLAQVIVDYLTRHLPKHFFERLWIIKLGDSVHGDIHGMAHRNFFPNSLKAALAIGDTEAQMFQWIAAETGTPVIVVSVSGNHSRRSAKPDYEDPHDNFDYLVSTQIATRLQHEIEAGPVSVYCPRAWTAFCDVRGHLWAANHGQDVRGYAGFPWYGFDRKTNRVQALIARKNARVKYFAYGHFHADAKSTSADAKIYHSGAFYMTDPHTAEKLALGNTPQQSFFVVDDEYGTILEAPIYIRDETLEARYEAGEFTPAFGQQLIIDELEPRQTEGLQVISA
jgi:hypothetical protein